MATNPRGMPTLSSALIRPTVPLSEPVADIEPENADEGRGAQDRPLAKPRRSRLKASTEKTSKRGLYLSDAIWEKLQLEGLRKRSNASAVASDLFERHLPKLRIERDV